jgi:hyperosmotically inducible periplasmic protein
MAMNTHQLLSTTAVLVALGAGAACNRADTDAQAKRAAADVRAAADKAGDALSDAWLTTQIQAKYFADREIKARYIDVSTRDRVVTVSGYVQSDDARRRALEIAKQANGVREVQDRLLIGRAPEQADRSLPSESITPSGHETPPTSANQPAPTSGNQPPASTDAGGAIDDARITATIQAKYFVTADVKGRNIDVDTRAGVVTLKGEVGSEREREEALRLARESPGVQRVEDMLTVNAAAR